MSSALRTIAETGLSYLISSFAYDIVGIYDQNFNQVLAGARPMKASVKPDSKTMDHPVEDGSEITDFRILLPIEIEFPVVMQSADYRDTYQELKDIFNNGTLLTIQTNADVYERMLIQSMPHEENAEQFDTLTAILKFKQVTIVVPQNGGPAPVKPTNQANSSTVDKGTVQPTTPSTPAQSELKGKYFSSFK